MARGRKKAEQGTPPADVREASGDAVPQAAWNLKKQVIPPGRTWSLLGTTSSILLHEGISASSAPHLLAGKTSMPLSEMGLGEKAYTELDGRRYVLQRTA